MAPAKAAWVDFKEIKARVSIVQILERYGVLDSLSKTGSGDRLSGACPIHGGTNKTHFRVSVSKNCWNCFGSCQAGGNVIDFVARKEDNETQAHPREVFRAAVIAAAYAVIVMHNHPSGDPTPSNADLCMTKRLVESGQILCIQVYDHIVVGHSQHLSLREAGAL